jgi:hypothetical protein
MKNINSLQPHQPSRRTCRNDSTVQLNHRIRKTRMVSPCVTRHRLVLLLKRPAFMSRMRWSSKMDTRLYTSLPLSPPGNLHAHGQKQWRCFFVAMSVQKWTRNARHCRFRHQGTCTVYGTHGETGRVSVGVSRWTCSGSLTAAVATRKAHNVCQCHANKVEEHALIKALR